MSGTRAGGLPGSTRRGPAIVVLAAVFALLSCGSCGATPAGPELADADLRVLFIGNSLTYVNDVPRLVRALARADGRSMSHVSVVAPDASLEDHWRVGAADHIRRLRPDVVVLQQGPSSLPESRVHLVHWTRAFDAVIREAGGIPALYMVWPPTSRSFAFPDVIASYAAAAEAVDGLLLPAGAAWVAAREMDPSLQLYGSDGVHASYLGALTAAHTIYAVLFDVDPLAVPRLDDDVSDNDLDVLRRAVGAAIEAWSAGQ